jgi:hypothetical protein
LVDFVSLIGKEPNGMCKTCGCGGGKKDEKKGKK